MQLEDSRHLIHLRSLIDKSNDRVSHFDKLPLTERLFGTQLTEELLLVNGILNELFDLKRKYANNSELRVEIYEVKKIARAIEFKIDENKEEKNTHYKKGININYYKIIKNIFKLFKRKTYTMVMSFLN